MRRLSGTDALFLSLETPAWHQHVGGLTILEPGDRPVNFGDVVERIDQRLDWAPKFRWKLASVPFGLDRPMWVDTPDFDVRRHIRRIGVPSPGGPRETAEVAGDLMMMQLDRRHPLWELWFLEGLAGGRSGLLMKYHHCLLDGISGASLATVLLDFAPDATEPMVAAPPPEDRVAGPQPPDTEIVMRVLSEAARRPFRATRYMLGQAERLVTGARFAAKDQRNRAMLNAPALPFNAQIGPRRALAFASVALQDLRQLRLVHNVKLNDVVLATVAGALREYLLDQDLLPQQSLVSSVPVSRRGAGDGAMENKVAVMFVSMATDIEDPVERLQAIAEASKSAKEMREAMGAHEIQSLGEVAPPIMLSTVIRALYETHVMTHVPRVPNLVVSNVPGPPMDLYMCGARVAGVYSASVLVESQGLNITVMSYGDRMDYGIHVDPDLVADPWVIAERIPMAMAELMKASGLGAPTPVKDPFGYDVQPG